MADIWCDRSLITLVVNVFTQIAWPYQYRTHATAIKKHRLDEIFKAKKKKEKNCRLCMQHNFIVTLDFVEIAKL